MQATILSQGRFVSNGATQILQLPSGVDWIKVRNWTTYTAGAAATVGIEFYWQKGMAAGDAMILGYTGASVLASATALNAAVPGFTIIDSTNLAPGPLWTTTAISNATPPLVTSTAGAVGTLANGDVVQFINSAGAQQLSGQYFTIAAVNAGAGTFTIPFMPPIVASALGGFYRKLPYLSLFTPRVSLITNVTRPQDANGVAGATIITLSTTNTLVVGQAVTFRIGLPYAMTQLNGLTGNIIAIGGADSVGYTNTVTVDIDSSGFTAFAFPLTAAPGFTPAQIVPFGETANAEILPTNPNLFDDAIVNSGYIGIALGAGAQSPAGVNGNVVYWQAGKSTYGNPSI
jgi:hypothetical protein